MIQSIEPTDFVNNLEENFHTMCNNKKITDEVIMEVCSTLNNFRTGVMETLDLHINKVERMIFRGCRVLLANGASHILKANYEHHRLRDDWTIYLTQAEQNRVSCVDGKYTWYCIKDDKKAFPKAGNEFIKLKFAKYDSKLIAKIVDVHDTYIKAYNKHFQSIQSEV